MLRLAVGVILNLTISTYPFLSFILVRVTPTANRNSCRVARLVGAVTQGSVLRPQPWAGKSQLLQSCRWVRTIPPLGHLCPLKLLQPTPPPTPSSPHLHQTTPTSAPSYPYLLQPTPRSAPSYPHLFQPTPCSAPSYPHIHQTTPTTAPSTPHLHLPTPPPTPSSSHLHQTAWVAYLHLSVGKWG